MDSLNECIEVFRKKLLEHTTSLDGLKIDYRDDGTSNQNSECGLLTDVVQVLKRNQIMTASLVGERQNLKLENISFKKYQNDPI